jgi:hypothetical protein
MTMVLVIFGCGSLAAWAEDTAPTTPSDAKKVETKTDVPTPAQLRVKMHRTLADLIEAQNAEKPDQAQIDKLTKDVEQLRAEIAAERPAFGRGPGMGYGRGPGRGPGYGRGAGGGLGFVDRNNNGICDFREAPPTR